MGKFQFKLQPVLDYRETLEEQAKVEYGRELGVKEDIQNKIVHLNNLLDDIIDQARQSSQQLIDPFKLKQYREYQNHLKDELYQTERSLMQQEVVVEEKREAMVQAMTDRKSVEIIKDRQADLYKEALKKQEQKITDSLVSFKYATARG